ncbi:hypothetical protein RJC98_16355 [Pseudomonas allii]|uniref:Uncharacterized protein n=2 Tax=Pseudomonas TaxID=286 RepID=A0ACC6LEN1_9PSED|nr:MULTISPECIES: hypothetical protein [Pseudomonas]MDR9876761.1 hypothetical protein [Pseudomonas allii]NWA10432.1 hypothetical protein [Pseudomonas gingeri]
MQKQIQARHRMQDSYSIAEHRHRFAIWAAGRAYSRQGPGHTMAVATQLINESGVGRISTPDDLPPPKEIDAFLDLQFRNVIKIACKLTYTRTWKDEITKDEYSSQHDLICSYGRAQKLVNVYLKSKLVCASSDADQSKISALHPPLDRQLLNAIDSYLAHPKHKGSDLQKKFKAALKLGKSWTTFKKPAYDAHLSVIKDIQAGRPLWGIEWLWHPSAQEEEDR